MTLFISKAQTYQNLVPNGSFETFTNCPFNNAQILFAPPWTGPTVNGSDYFNSCSSNYNVPYYFGTSSAYLAYLDAKSGQAYTGIYSYQLGGYREYLECKLIDSLTIGQCYYIEFFATSGQYVKYRSNNIAASFSDVSFASYSSTPLPLPQIITNYGNTVIRDTVKWERISGIYQATAIDKYIIIGNFKGDSQTDTINNYSPGQNQYYTSSDAYVLIDAVSVFSINPTGNLPWKYRDTTIIEGDSVYIGNTMGGSFNPQWFTIGGNYITTNAGIYVKPVATTSYVVNYTVCGTPRSDTVEVKVVSDIGVREKLLNEMEFKIFPSPVQNEISIEFEKDFTKPKTIVITDVAGRTIRSVNMTLRKQTLDVSELKAGCYFVSHQNSAGLTITKKIVKQ